MQPVGGEEVASGFAVDQHPVVELADVLHRSLLDGDAGGRDRRSEGVVEHGAAYAASRAGGEAGGRADAPAGRVEVVDAGERAAGRVHAEVGELGDGSGHQPLAARLVDRPVAGLADHHGQPGAVRVERRREAHRSAAGDDEVTHRRAR